MANGMRRLWAVVLLLAAGTAGRARAEAVGAAPLADDSTLIALAVSLACADAPEASAGVPAEPPPSASGPEIELVATVRARSLRFDVVPKVNVTFRGSKRRTVWKTERVNLPAHPEPGVVYHDVEVRLTISSTVEELASLIAEAERAAKGIRIDHAAPLAAAAPAAPAAPATPPANPAAVGPAPAAAGSAKPVSITAAAAPAASTASPTPAATAHPTATVTENPAPADAAKPTSPEVSATGSTPTATTAPTATPTAAPDPTATTPTATPTSASSSPAIVPAPAALASPEPAAAAPAPAAASH